MSAAPPSIKRYFNPNSIAQHTPKSNTRQLVNFVLNTKSMGTNCICSFNSGKNSVAPANANPATPNNP